MATPHARALELLEQAWAARDRGLTTLRYWPIFRTLRNEPRYLALTRKAGLPVD
jgi:hypothetical protein